MEAWLLYLLQVSFTQVILFALYWLMLRKDTFHQLNRVYLLVSMGLSALLPLIIIPQLFLSAESAATVYLPEGFLAWHSAAAQEPPAMAEKQLPGFLLYLYCLGAAICLLKLGFRLWSVYTYIQRCTITPQANYLLAAHGNANSPFSFFRYVVVNPELYKMHTLQQIIKHEQVHVIQWHTLDILFAEMYTALFWFNPLAWRQTYFIRLTLEYLADEGALEKLVSKKQYQLTFLEVSLKPATHYLTANFNQSSIKKRITMMNFKRSPKIARYKYIFPLPFIVALLLIFNMTRAGESINQFTNISVPAAETGLSQKGGKISGVVKDADTDKPLAGVQVSVKGHNTQTTTGGDGKFSIETDKADKVLVFQAGGYTIAQMAITTQQDMVVFLKIADRLKFGPDSNIMADQFITNNSGETIYLGSTIKIVESSDSLQTQAIYFIDGKKADKEVIKKLSPEVIKLVNVYKGYEAEKKYGAEGKNGVVEIITKE
jgi:hypothetical protein